jgi:hypothetical protein
MCEEMCGLKFSWEYNVKSNQGNFTNSIFKFSQNHLKNIVNAYHKPWV